MTLLDFSLNDIKIILSWANLASLQNKLDERDKKLVKKLEVMCDEEKEFEEQLKK